MASTDGSDSPGFSRTPFHDVTRSQCEYCPERMIGPERVVEDWEKQHRKRCEKRSGTVSQG